MTNSISAKLPDFRLLGVIVRCLILAEALHVVSVLSHAPSLDQAFRDFLQGAVLFEPVLLTALVALFLLSPWVERLRYGVGVAVVFMLVSSAQTIWWTLLKGFHDELDSQWLGTLVGSLAVTAALLFYFRWRQVKFAPELAQANFLALQARIRPHFLFNSLNSVLSLMPEDPKRAEVMLGNLSELFRAVLAEERSLVTLKQEIDLAKTYLDIEGIRLGDRLRVRWDCDPGLNTVLLPPLVIQPLVENAIVHGISQCADGGLIRIEASKSQGELLLTVSNPRPPRHSPAPLGSRTALENIKGRLELHFDVEGRLEIKESPTQFEIRIRTPLHDKKTNQSHHR